MVWIIAGAGAVLSQLINLSAWISVVCLAVFALLLCTTPTDAIRLPRWLSVVLIGGGAIALQITGLDRGRTTLPAAAILLLILTAAMLLLQRSKRSIWWATLLAWGPWALRNGWL